jgi:hypothetical protein
VDDLRSFTLWARALLTREAEELLLQIYGLESTGEFLPDKKLPVLDRVAEARDTRARLKKLFADEKDADLAAAEAYRKLVKEIAFTHLNRLVAFKLLEGRKLIRGTLDKYHDSNGFKMYLASHEPDLKLYEQGTMPQDDMGEGPRDRAYRHFLLWQSGELAKEVRVLFDTDNLSSRLFPRSRVLHELIERSNAEEMQDAWGPGSEETIGWVYQFFNAEEKDAAFYRVFREKEKFKKDDIPAATQVFTPRWIVRFLVENSLGRLWVTMHPDSSLADSLEYLVPLPSDPPKVPLKPVKEIRVLDPATGTMHFGLVAFDLFITMYQEERKHAGTDGWPGVPSVQSDKDIPAAIVSNNLFGIDIDLRAVQLASLALYLRAKTTNRDCILTESNLACADVAIFRGQHLSKIASEMALPVGVTGDLFRKFCESVDDAGSMGSLVRLERHFRNLVGDQLRKLVDDYVRQKAKQGEDESYFGNETSKGLRLLDVLTRRYDVVFTNPPYMSRHNMKPEMADFLSHQYKRSKGDLYSAFIDRCTELLEEGGRVAMITQQSFMFLVTYEALRDLLLSRTSIEGVAHLGPRAFPTVKGEKVNAVAFVLRQEDFEELRRKSVGVYFRLVKEPSADAKRARFEESLLRRKQGEMDSGVYEYSQGDHFTIPGRPWVYQITPGLTKLFSSCPLLVTKASARQGLATADNARFIRFWWEIGVSRIVRGATSRNDFAKHGGKWCPHLKGGGEHAWVANKEFVINWGNDGAELVALQPKAVIRNAEYYFRTGITYNAVSSRAFKGMLMPNGFIFDSAGDCVFPEDAALAVPLLGLLNSKFARGILTMLNPTLNVYTSDLDRLPIPRKASTALNRLAADACRVSLIFENQNERTYNFVTPPDWHSRDQFADPNVELGKIEREIDEEVYGLFDISDDDRQAIEIELAEPIMAGETENENNESDENNETASHRLGAGSQDSTNLARQWVSYAMGVALGRFQPGVEGAIGRGKFPTEVNTKLRALASTEGIMPLEEGHPDDLAQRILEVFHVMYSDHEVEHIVRLATGNNGALRQSLADYLVGPFFKDHVRHYRRRPIYWLLQSPDRNYGVYLFHECATGDTLSLLQGNRYVGGKIHRVESDLQQAKQKEGATIGRDKTIWARQARDLAELLDDLRAFDQRITVANSVQIKDRDGYLATVGWRPELDDGVLLNAAPLHDLAPAWKKADSKLDLKKAWKDLENEKYDWAKTAMRYWPQRVLRGCKKDTSFAIAHELRAKR